jgi:aerobic carbon-monoxide dehydrogenase small subunit
MEYDVELTVNGAPYKARVAAGLTLMRMLRDELHLGGTKEGCGIGECGACAVILDGKLVNACMVLAVECNGAQVRTIEGEGRDELSDLQQAFIDHHALQCGFCTPGMIMAARELIERKPDPTEEDIVEAMAGQVCRCTGYVTPIAAIRSVVAKKQGGAR